jgi:hypothetical protein
VKALLAMDQNVLAILQGDLSHAFGHGEMNIQPSRIMHVYVDHGCLSKRFPRVPRPFPIMSPLAVYDASYTAVHPPELSILHTT